MDDRSGYPTQTAYTLQVGKPVVSDDLLSETRFSAPAAYWSAVCAAA